MTRTQKLRDKILRKPVPSDIRSDELRQFLLGLGMVEIKVGKTAGSRIKFANPSNLSQQIRLHKAHGSTPVDKGALTDVIITLRKMGLLESSNE